MNAQRLGVTAITMLLMAPPVSAQTTETFELSGERIAIYNLAGVVEIRGGTGRMVRVDVALGGPDADELRIETGPIDGHETLRVVYPADEIVYGELGGRSRSQIRVRPDGTFFGDRRRGDRVTIRGSGDGLEAHADLVITVPAGQSIDVRLGVGEVTAENVSGTMLIDVASAPVTARETQGTLRVDTGSGAVSVTDASGDVEVDTGSGRVTVSSVTGSRLSVDTGSGGVSGDRVEADVVDIDTGSGRIDIAGLAMRRGRFDTGSGGVELDLLTDVDDLEIDTGSGGVTIHFTDALGATLDLESGSGGIDFDVPVQVSRFDRSSLRGTIGDGEGRIAIDTGSGSIRFMRR